VPGNEKKEVMSAIFGTLVLLIAWVAPMIAATTWIIITLQHIRVRIDVIEVSVRRTP